MVYLHKQKKFYKEEGGFLYGQYLETFFPDRINNGTEEEKIRQNIYTNDEETSATPIEVKGGKRKVVHFTKI